MTRSPSVTGEAEHCGLVEWVGSLSSGVTPPCQRVLPSVRSKQSNARRLSFFVACVTKTRFPQMMGVEFPLSGRGTRQRTFVFVSQRSGRFFSDVIPEPSGPRQAGQLAAGACKANESDRSAREENEAVFMECIASMDALNAARI